MLPLGGAGAVVIHRAAQLAHILNDHIHPVRVALAQVAATEVVGPHAAQVDDAAGHIILALALFAPAVVLKLKQDGVGKGVIAAGDVDVLARDAGQVKDARRDIMAGHPADWPVLVVKIAARLGAAPLHRLDVDGLVLQVFGAVGGSYDDAGSVVRFQAAVQQVRHRADNPAGVHHIVHGDPVLHQRLGVVGGVIGMGHFDGGQILAFDAVFGHMAGESIGKLLDGADEAVGPLQQIRPADGRRGPRPGAADADIGIPVHRPENGDHIAHPRFNGPDRQPHQRLRGRPAAGAVHIKVGPDAQVILDGSGRGRIPAVIGKHPVHLVGGKAGVVHGVADGLGAHRAGSSPRSAAVFRFAHAHDAVFVSRIAGHSVPSDGGKAAS